MRVAIDCRYVRERPSGIGAYVQALVERVPALAPSDTFELWASHLSPSALSAAPNVTEHTVRAPANGLRTLAIPSRLAPLAGVDVFHATFNILGRGVPAKRVVTVHDLMWLLHPTWCEGLSPLTPLQYAFYRDGILRALKEAERLVAITQATADSIAATWPDATRRVRVIHHGLEPRFGLPADRREAEKKAHALLGSDEPYFLVVGQNAPSKFHRGILEAFAGTSARRTTRLVLLQRLFQGGRFWALGGDRLGEVARRLGVADRVTWLPRAGEAGVVALLQSALALVQFSRFEGFGMPVLEAMGCGAPVIASDIPALREVAGGAAYHVPLEIAALGRAMDRLASDPALRRDLSQRGAERSRSFSWDRCAAQHLEVYREAANS